MDFAHYEKGTQYSQHTDHSKTDVSRSDASRTDRSYESESFSSYSQSSTGTAKKVDGKKSQKYVASVLYHNFHLCLNLFFIDVKSYM